MPGLASRLENLELVAFDLETTGLSPQTCAILEMGAMRFTLPGGGAEPRELGAFEQLVAPGCPIPAVATRVHGITDDMVDRMPPLEEVLPEFLAFLGGEETVLLAHNASFDVRFVAAAAARIGIHSPPHVVVDSAPLARRCLPGLPSYRLEHLGIELGVADSEDHRALSDSRLLAGVFAEIIRRTPSLATLEDLCRLSRPLRFDNYDGLLRRPPEGYEALAAAMAGELAVLLIYDGGSYAAIERRVTPRFIVRRRGRLYLQAFCHIDRIDKTYRLDRIREFFVEES